MKDKKTPKFRLRSSLLLRRLKGSHFHLAMALAGIVHHAFETFGNIIRDPIRAVTMPLHLCTSVHIIR